MSAMNAPEPERPQEKDKLRLLRRRRDRPRMTLRQRMPAEKLRKGVYLIPESVYRGQFDVRIFFDHRDLSRRVCQRGFADSSRQRVRWRGRLCRRLTRTTSQFGVEFDSLADVVAFGVAPAVLVYIWALMPWQNWGWLAAATYVVCGAARLSRFNVQAQGPAKNHFVGLPIPAAAQMISVIGDFILSISVSRGRRRAT